MEYTQKDNMKLTKTTEHNLTFSVWYHYSSEGGVDSEQFGNDVKTLEEAIEIWDLANVSRPAEDWVIVGTVEKVIKK